MIRINSIETFGTHEGPGIRLVVFTQGCLLRCAYCHNPETQALTGGTLMKPAEILRLLKQQKTYFKGKMGGGLTVSGGEPTLQAKELIPLFRACRKIGIHTALDTNGAIDTPVVKTLYDLTDLVLLDIKHIDNEKHLRLTKASNQKPLEWPAYREASGKPFWIRYVLVPGWTNDTEDLKRFAEHFRDYKHLERVEILPYHTMAAEKYRQLGQPNPLEGVAPPTQEDIHHAADIFRKQLGDRVFIR